MCRVLAYLGDGALIDEFLYLPDAALVRQATDPHLMRLLNLGGFGLAAWDAESPEPAQPYTYRTAGVPMFDRNLKALAEKVRATALVAHVRGVVYEPSERVGPQNVHPFRFPGAAFALAQNGDLYDFGRMRFDLLAHIRPDVATHIEGTTDTEWFYALCLSQLEDPWSPCDADAMAQAVLGSLAMVRDVRAKHGIDRQSPINVVLSDGRSLVATRYTFDYGWYLEDESFFAGEREFDFTTLWYTAGGGYEQIDGEWQMAPAERANSILVASEPLTRDSSTWLQTPEYTMLVAQPAADGAGLDIDLREVAL
jgi:glutamine amidotransferase